MATRKHKAHNDSVRARMQVSHLITRLTKYAMGELSDADISSTRFNAIKLLLSKSLPDLAAVQMTTIHQGDIKHTVTVRVIKPSSNP